MDYYQILDTKSAIILNKKEEISLFFLFTILFSGKQQFLGYFLKYLFNYELKNCFLKCSSFYVKLFNSSPLR